MQQFTIPQFIDVEDKIIGPITTRQFVIMLGAFIIMAICYKIFDFSLFLTVSIIIFILCGVFSFAKVNGRPFHFFILNIVQTLKRPKLRTWSNTIGKTDEDYKVMEEITQIAKIRPVKTYTISRLAELSLVVDTGGAYEGEKGEKTEIRGM